jgi:K(+)-stimulated pyrophosphate-energized sodium pump
MNPELLQAFIPIAGLLAVGFAIFLARDVLSRDTGTKEMMDVSATINEGAVAFIKRQYLTIGILALVGSVVIFGIISLLETVERC